MSGNGGSGPDADASGDDFSSLGGFFFYAFIVHPCTAWILRPGRFPRQKSIMYAIAFLAALAAIKTGECLEQFEEIVVVVAAAQCASYELSAENVPTLFIDPPSLNNDNVQAWRFNNEGLTTTRCWM